MASPHPKLRTFLSTALVVGALLALSGCVPTTWLPDSSGFVYVKPMKGQPGAPPTGQLLHFDLKTKNSRVVVNDIGSGTMWPAVSGEGKRIAVAKFKTGADKGKTVQFVIYDLQGKALKQSKEFGWVVGKKEGISFSAAGMLFWSPKGDMIVVSDLSDSAIYNVATDSLKMLPEAMPAIHGGSPIRPDGAGFLAVIGSMGKSKESRLVFIDWTGAEQKIDTAQFDKTLLTASKGKKKDDAGGPFIMSILFPSGWNGTTAWVGFRREKMTWQIDTVKKSASIADTFAAKIAIDAKGHPLSYDFPGDVSVQVTEFREDSPDKKSGKNYNKVAIVNHKTGKQEVVLPKGPSAALFLPSPDGNYLNVSLGEVMAQEPSPMHILVINSKGEVHSRIVVDPTK